MKGRTVPISRSWKLHSTAAPLAALVFAASGLLGCNPTVKVEAPDKPIVINLNVKIDQEVRVKVDKDVESLVDSNPNLF
jgi:hypothetical protein